MRIRQIDTLVSTRAHRPQPSHAVRGTSQIQSRVSPTCRVLLDELVTSPEDAYGQMQRHEWMNVMLSKPLTTPPAASWKQDGCS